MTRSLYSGAVAILLALAAPGLPHAENTGLGPWQVRVRATYILPDEDASIPSLFKDHLKGEHNQC